MTDHPQIQIRRLIKADAPLFRQIRLEALKLSPEAFGSSFEQESAQSLGHFEEALSRSDVFGAFRGADLVGVAGYRAQGGAKQAHKFSGACTFVALSVAPASPDNSSRRSSAMHANGSNSSN